MYFKRNIQCVVRSSRIIHSPRLSSKKASAPLRTLVAPRSGRPNATELLALPKCRYEDTGQNISILTPWINHSHLGDGLEWIGAGLVCFNPTRRADSITRRESASFQTASSCYHQSIQFTRPGILFGEKVYIPRRTCICSRYGRDKKVSVNIRKQ